jgi:ABC-type multidrug transport system fused ATPase/permease subunit
MLGCDEVAADICIDTCSCAWGCVMQRVVEGAAVLPLPMTSLRRWLRRLWLVLGSVFAFIGLSATGLLLISWVRATEWSFTEFENLTHDIAAFAQQNFVSAVTIAKNVLELVSLVLIAIAAFIATMRMPMLARIIRDFITARGSIYTLQNIITDAGKMVQSVSSLEPTIQILAEKVDAAQVQLGELQRYTSSQRLTTGGAEGAGTDANGTGGDGAVDDDAKNWEKLRAFYYANTSRLEGIIDKIPDMRTKNKYRKMRKSNYTPIIRALAKDEFITPAAEKASIDLNRTFKRYQPRNRKVTDKVIGDMAVLDALLEQLIGKSPPDEEEDDASSATS